MIATYNGKNSCPLLNRLQSRAEDCPTAKVKCSRMSPSRKYINVAITLVFGIFHDGIKLLDFCNELWVILGEIAAELRQDLNGFRATMVGNEPSAISY